jgi:predicted permease
VKSIGYELSPLYNGLLGIKILLGFAIFYLASVLSGRSEKAKAFREREIHWLNILCILMIVTVMIASYMKMSSSSFPKKDKTETTAQKIATEQLQLEQI